MNRFWLLYFLSSCVFACPNCGGLSSSFDGNKIFILSLFIIFTYIPMSILFRMAIKQRKKNPSSRNQC